MRSFQIRSSTIRLAIFISAIIVATIIVFQLIWLKKVYTLEQKDFNHNIVKTVRGLYEDLEVNTYNFSHLNTLIENKSPNLYLAHIPLPVDKDSLINYLQYELEDNGVFTNCMLGVYEADSSKYIYTVQLTSAGVKGANISGIPQSASNVDHIALYFPNRKSYILYEMNFWIVSSVVLLIVLILFTGSLFYFYKQKFANETQRDFIHSFTHEFKTPVAVITLAAEVLKDPQLASKPDKLQTYAGIVEYQAGYLKDQVERLLQFAHAESNQLHLQKVKVDMHKLIDEAIINLTPLVNDKMAIIGKDYRANHPLLNVDKNYMLIVITSLLDNALKYSRTPQVQIETIDNANGFTISIADNGIGIEQGQLKHIFKKFYRVKQGEVYAAKGFGLGLSFVKMILDAHHASIKVSSEVDKGSKFTIVIQNK